ncbi:LacI family DNA-binding transcriptional regulator [Rathayibacter sp. VKM Ac-2760]|uniref:LacI family DNA-binding transcriptional regulator n=1 Tax=Rathayibacter sp. VKM Ac-2760 TaxID=2609253 RepID=UPI0013195D5C|nr:LacI family DNA-binding transcriptional regulator [Rathayibacter sp. VKM Ac-2760]QHC61172.1 substrate-binding domain-containing protein [Rathayibacter sp. VKM Ac-2760]
MTTRREVAAAAGVSVRTVSNVVNGFASIAPDTRQRVLDVIESLDYRPSEMARSLKVGRTGLIGLMLPELDTPYFAELTRAFVEAGAERGITVVIDQTNGDPDREREFISRSARGGLFDALALNPIALDPIDVAVLRAGGPAVFLGETDIPGFDHVAIDNRTAAREAVEHLIARGHRRIGVIGSRQGGEGTIQLRNAGYEDALRAADLPVLNGGAPETAGFRREYGAAAMRELLNAPVRPDGVFCYSDPLAAGALRSLHEVGLRCPEDIAIVGFDDIEEGRFSSPSITSISPDKDWIARTALDRLIRRLSGEDLRAATITAPHRLVIRESSGG